MSTSTVPMTADIVISVPDPMVQMYVFQVQMGWVEWKVSRLKVHGCRRRRRYLHM